MTFKGQSLRFTRLGLFAVLLLIVCICRVHAQAGPEQSYRIVLLEKKTQAQLADAKKLLEGMKLPGTIHVEEAEGRITYGDYATAAEAEAARKALYAAESLNSKGVVAVAKPSATPAPTPESTPTGDVLTIHIRDFKDRVQADALMRKLQPQYGSVMIRQIGNFYEVLVGQYGPKEAAVALGQIKADGYADALVEPLPAVGQPIPSGIVIAKTAPEAAGVEDKMLPITQTEIWKKMTEDQKRRVQSDVGLQRSIRMGDPLASELFDLKKRIDGLDDRVKKVVENYDAEKKVLDEQRKKINQTIDEAEDKVKTGKLPDALLKLAEIKELDRENVFRTREYVDRRIEVVQSMQRGESYPGQMTDNTKKVESLKKQVQQIENSNDTAELSQAKAMWIEIKDLNPALAKDAETHISRIVARTREIADTHDKTQSEEQNKLKMIINGLIGAVAVILVLVMFIGLRSRKRHQELMRKVQEITSIRPMRELEGSGPQLLGSGGEDVFSPMNSSGEGAVDPLGGVLTPPPPPDKKGKGKKGKAAPAPAAVAAATDSLDDIFGGGPSAGAGDMSGGDMGLDDIFGAPSPAPAKAAAPVAQPATPAAPAAPSPEVSHTAGVAASDIDDIFGGLFADEPKTPAAPAHDATNSPAHDTGPISFSDIMTAGANPGDTTSQITAGDLLTVMDDQVPTTKTAPKGVDPLQDSPFASMFSDTQREAVTANTHAKDDETEIPSIKLDSTVGGEATTAAPSFGGLELNDLSQAGGTTPVAESRDLPAFSFDDFMGGSTAISSNGHPGIELDFEQETPGQAPSGWEGQYSFARLAVEADTPPKGSQQYLCFEKKEGAGKAHYSCRFGDVSGVIGIEFDLRCNDKNKFLLGFYIEKDGDFQHSINTKILRSEAQTSPTIHMQGQSAPYLLGSWAHIKYVVDLTEGRVNGYIDSTHVVRDLPLSPNPGSLNTLSIRDNINTTGVLLLDNIKVYEIH